MPLLRELTETLRQLRRAPGFTLSACCMLVFGIAISVAMFSLLRGILLVALPFPQADQLVEVNARAEGESSAALTPSEAVELSRLADQQDSTGTTLRQFGYYNWGGMTLFDGEHPRETGIALVSSGFFPTMGLQPELGRWFAPEEHGSGSTVVVLAHSEWQQLLGGRADAIGQMVDTSEGRLQVIGVMPEAFGYPGPGVGAWLPRAPYNPERPGYEQARFVYGVARLAPGVSAVALDQQLASKVNVDAGTGKRWSLASSGLLEAAVGDLRGTLWSALAIAVLVLLIAAVNVTILFDARQVQRTQARQVAQALGASQARVWRVQIMELAVLAVAGGLLGVLLAWLGLESLRELARSSLPRVDAITLDGSVLLFAAALALLLPVLVGLLTLPRSRTEVPLSLRSGSRTLFGGRQGWRRLLPALAVGLSTTSLVAALALGLSLRRLQDVDPGFEPAQVRAVQLFRPGSPAQLQAFVDAAQSRLAALPGVTAVSYSAAPPLAVSASLAVELTVPDRTQAEPYRAGLRRVGPEYLELLKIPLLAGRAIDATDGATGEPVAVISAELARRSFGQASALGQLLRLDQGQGTTGEVRVIGVMADTRNAGLRASPQPELLLPYAQGPAPALTMLVRTAGSVLLSDRELASPIYAIDPRQAIARQYTLQEELDSQLQPTRFFALAIGLFACAAFVLAAFGVYAVAALRQRQKVREFGLRAAIGARASTLGLQVLREGFFDVLPGAIFGCIGATLTLQLLADQLFELAGQEFLLTAACVSAMLLAALTAMLPPAWRAARADPMRVLRSE